MEDLNSRGMEESGFRYLLRIPLHLLCIMIACTVAPFVAEYFFRQETPLVIYLVSLIPIILFAFYFSLVKMLLWIGVFSVFHISLAVFYQVQIDGGAENLDIRLFNHVGFTLISFGVGLLLGKLLKELKESDFRYRSVVENSPQLILIHQNGTIIYANPTMIELSGVNKPSDLIGKSIFDFIHPSGREKLINRNQAVLENRRGNQFIEYKFISSNGKHLDLEVLGNVINYQGKAAIMVIGLDVTAKKENQRKIEHMAYHDSLTGLPNRYLLDQSLDEALACSADNTKEMAIMFLDLDRFKVINDTMGHRQGDSLLVKVSQRLVKNVRAGDIVARQGGDEFLILLKGTNAAVAKQIANRIITSFSRPFFIEEEEIYTTPSIGISLYPKDGKDKETLTKHADTAMYMAKERGKNNVQFYSNKYENSRERNNRLEQALNKALINNEFELFYQPEVELETSKIFSVEALLRWNHEELGEIPPDEFIPIAEETGMIIPIGKWVLNEACRQNKQWQETGIDVKIGVNVSAIQFEDPHFVEMVKAALAESQLSPEKLILEITESVMQNIKNSSSIISILKKLGVKVAIDDFGTGYSSLSVLNKLPFDFVKIDKSFVSESTTDENTASLIKTMIEMGVNLQFDLIAEGIETSGQASFLTQNGCRYGQGYLYSPPLPVGEIEKLL
jgi:diguanylate cyclase (GGDEF)-like protein/PAS domain S-box-containing protein